MSVTGHYDHLVRKAINNEMLRKSRLNQAAYQARAGRGRHLTCHVLNWLGGRMIAWGQRLRERYEPALRTPVPQTN